MRNLGLCSRGLRRTPRHYQAVALSSRPFSKTLDCWRLDCDDDDDVEDEAAADDDHHDDDADEFARIPMHS